MTSKTRKVDSPGNAPNGSSGRRVRRDNGGNPADWQGVNGELLARTVAVVAMRGGALRLGYTRDGGAYSIGVYGDGEPYTEYVRPGEGIEDYLIALIESWR